MSTNTQNELGGKNNTPNKKNISIKMYTQNHGKAVAILTHINNIYKPRIKACIKAALHSVPVPRTLSVTVSLILSSLCFSESPTIYYIRDDITHAHRTAPVASTLNSRSNRSPHVLLLHGGA